MSLAPVDLPRGRCLHADRIAGPPDRTIFGAHFKPVHSGRIQLDALQLLQSRSPGRNLPHCLAIEQHLVGRSPTRGQVLEAVLRSHRQQEFLSRLHHGRSDGVDELHAILANHLDRGPLGGQQPAVTIQVHKSFQDEPVVRPALHPQARTSPATVAEGERHGVALAQFPATELERDNRASLEGNPSPPRLGRGQDSIGVGGCHRDVARAAEIVRLQSTTAALPDDDSAADRHGHVPNRIRLTNRYELASTKGPL